MLNKVDGGAATILMVGEDACQKTVGPAEAFDAVEQVFAALASGDAWNFPVVRENLGHADAVYGFKSISSAWWPGTPIPTCCPSLAPWPKSLACLSRR